MKLRIEQGLLFTTVVLHYRERSLVLGRVLVDTGSAGTVFQVDQLEVIGLVQEPQDLIHRIYGVGGEEFVFSKEIEQLAVGELVARPFRIEIGALAYGLELDGILGLDFLLHVGAVLDLSRLMLRSS